MELVDFTPTSQNVEYYARIVGRKARERKINRLAYELVIDPGNFREVFPCLSELQEEEQFREPGKRLKALSLQEILQTSFPERESLLSPIILTQSLSMIHAWRGLGKTHVGLGIAYAVASGGEFLKWRSPQPRGVLYLDGEMPGSALKERLAAITASNDGEPLPDYFRIITPDLQELGCMPDLSTLEGQTAVNAMLTPETALIVVDNISCLCRSGRENEAESWLPVQGWALRQRAAGRAVLFIHHSGKNGEQRGASKREDILDTVIKLKRPVDYDPSQGAVFEVIFEKARYLKGVDTASFEARLTTNPRNDLQEWVYKDVALTSFDRVIALANEGLSQSEIANELQLNKSNVSRHWKKGVEQGLIQNARK
ncbi:MAG: AAA family ATPase [Desulfuromonadales bacterium]|nr:AAA family ATPase [Desulfuromonadales bacterium]